MHNDAGCINMPFEHNHLSRDDFSNSRITRGKPRQPFLLRILLFLIPSLIWDGVSKQLDKPRELASPGLSPQGRKTWIFCDSLSWAWLFKRHKRTGLISFLLFSSIFLCTTKTSTILAGISWYNNSKVVTIFCVSFLVEALGKSSQNVFHHY